jgi:hypothetical protein
MNDIDAVELAALRERAYGPAAAGLSGEEVRRLQGLETASRSIGRRGGIDAPGSAAPGSAASGSAASGSASPPATTTDSAVVTSEPEPRTGLSGAAKLLLVVAAALIPVAAVTGFLAASAIVASPVAPTPTALVMADDVDLALREQQRTEVLAFQDWDGGDVTFWGAVEDVSVWWGTADGTTCVVVTLDRGGSVPICADTAAARAQGIREEVEFFHVDSEVPGAEGLIDVTDVPSTRVVFAGNPYTGPFILLRDD